MVQWFKRHPDFLIAESKALAASGNYKELFQDRDNFFVSHGEIIVRRNGTYRHPILIFYTQSTPYSLPEVYPLSRCLNEEEVKKIAQEGITGLPNETIKYYYEYRHQNGTGRLCILESDNLDTGSEFFNVKNVIQRVHAWYEGHRTGEFPPDSEEIELSAHFTNLNDSIRFFYSDEFMNAELVGGDFLGISMFSPGANRGLLRNVFFGARMNGFTKAGIWQDSVHPIHSYLERDGFHTPLDFVTKMDLLQNLIQKGDYLKGYWFDIANEPLPFKDVQQLVKMIGNNDYDIGLQRISKVCLDQIKILPSEIVFAVRYNNRKGLNEFQLFTIHKKAAASGVLLNVTAIEQVTSILENYDIVKAVKCEKFTEDSFFQRNGKQADHHILRAKTLNIIGAGAIGSELADSIGKAGVGTLNIIDNQSMGVQNSVRHLVGIEHMGVPKSIAVKAIIENHNPFIKINACGFNIMNEEIGLILPEESISISSIADDNVEGFLNEQAVLYGKRVYYVRALRGGKVARIFRVIPGVDACFYCLQLHRENNEYFINVPADPEYKTLRNECNNPIRPASAADLKLISSLAARIVLQQLINESETNHWVWTTEAIDGTLLTEPHKVYSHTIPIHPHCPYCNGSSPVIVRIMRSVLEEMKGRVIPKAGIETGGVLAGYIENGSYNILFASDAGPNAVERADRFEKDVPHCQAFLDDLYTKYGDKGVYLGEWHSHPNSNNKPSNIDISSLANIATHQNYLTSKPAMIIFSSTGDPSCTIHPVGSRFYNVQLEIIDNK